jgi:hypothetical protein
MKNAMERNRSRNASGIWNSSKEIFSTASSDPKRKYWPRIDIFHLLTLPPGKITKWIASHNPIIL